MTTNVGSTVVLRKKANSHGFTLVELLVVIGIIGVLVSIILPSMRKARDSAIRIGCVSNLRQIAIGINMYANANRGLTPQLINSHRRGGTGGYELLSDAWMRDYGKDDWGGLGLVYRQGILKSYLTFYCPAYQAMKYDSYAPEYYFPNGNPDNNNYYIVWSLYDIRNAWAHDGVEHKDANNIRDGNANGKIAHLRKNRIAAWDQVDINKQTVHKTGINVGYYDGHVGWYEDKKNFLKINIWDGGRTHDERVLNLMDVMER